MSEEEKRQMNLLEAMHRQAIALEEIARILQENRYIRNYVEVEDNKQNILRLYLKYDSKGKKGIFLIKRISKPGLRIYFDKEKLRILG